MKTSKASNLFFTLFDKGNGMTTKKNTKTASKKASKGKTYSQIIKTEAEGNVLEYSTDKNDCLIFWEDLRNICLEHFGEDISKSYDRSIQNEVIRKTLEDREKLYFQIEGTDRFTLKSYKGSKVIELSAIPQKLSGMLEADKGHSLQNRVHTYNAYSQLVSADTIFVFPSRNNDTKVGGFLELLRWRLSAILSGMKGQKTDKLFVFYMGKPQIADCKKSFGKCTSLLKSGKV